MVKLNGISAAEDSAYEAEEEKANDAESPAPSQMGYKIANALKDILEASLDEDAENKALADQEAAEEALKELEREDDFLVVINILKLTGINERSQEGASEIFDRLDKFYPHELFIA